MNYRYKATRHKRVGIIIKDGLEYVTGFVKESGIHEWNGITQMHSSKMQLGTGHVFQMVEAHLPVKYLDVRTREVDTMSDYDNAVAWVKNGFC